MTARSRARRRTGEEEGDAEEEIDSIAVGEEEGEVGAEADGIPDNEVEG